MRYFVFRNQTVEPFLGESDRGYSAYSDISQVPDDAERFIWFYQVPFNPNSRQVADEVATYADKLGLVSSLIGDRELWVFSLVNLFRCPLTGSDTLIDEAVDAFNAEVRKMAREHTNIKLIDFTDFTSRYASDELVNWKFYLMSQTSLSPKLAKDFAAWFARKEEELAGKRKKCLVLDLDNTLWGGILGEDGMTGIQIGDDYPGNAYRYWQQALLELQQTGVILTACSKNNEADVMEVWEKHPFMVLRKEHFSAWRINWNDKATNIAALATELNIGLDSMVFIDDNPKERALVKQALPMVSVPDFPQKPFGLMTFFRQLVNDHFRIYATTDEDRHKTAQYKAQAQRAAARSQFAGFDSYLKSLDIQISVIEADDFHVSRIAQMTQKTNQFNLTTHRLTEQEVRQHVAEGWKIFCMRESDRFGDNGIVGAMFITGSNHIDNLLLSCRVLGQGIEQAFVAFVLNHLYQGGTETVTATYRPSAKNAQTALFYEGLGFEVTAEDAESKQYSMKMTGKLPVKAYYHIKME